MIQNYHTHTPTQSSCLLSETLEMATLAQELAAKLQALEFAMKEFATKKALFDAITALEQKIWMTKNVLSLKEAAVYMDVSESYLHRLTSQREIPFSKPHGKLIYFERAELDRWMRCAAYRDYMDQNKIGKS